VRAVSPYTMLALPGRAPEGGFVPSLNMPVPEQCKSVGPWLLAELKQAVADLKVRYPKPRDFARHRRVGLATAGAEVHVTPWDEEGIDLIVDPVFLADGLGRWPCAIHWGSYGFRCRAEDAKPYIVLVTPDTRYYVARCVIPTL